MIAYKKSQNDPPEKWIPLSEIVNELPLGHWVHNQLLSSMDVVFEWHRLPSEFGLCDPSMNLVYMSAYTESKRQMQAVDEWQQMEEMKKNV